MNLKTQEQCNSLLDTALNFACDRLRKVQEIEVQCFSLDYEENINLNEKFAVDNLDIEDVLTLYKNSLKKNNASFQAAAIIYQVKIKVKEILQNAVCVQLEHKENKEGYECFLPYEFKNDELSTYEIISNTYKKQFI